MHWKTDDQGFRIGANTAVATEMTLAALGDSFVSAMQVEHEETMTHLLEEHLASRSGKSLRILNTGVEGWDPNQYRIELERILSTRSIDGVLVFIFLGNDVVKAPVETYLPREPVVRHSLRFPKKLDRNELIDAIAYPVNDFLEVRSHLFILMKNRSKYALMRAGLTAYYFPNTLLVSQVSSRRWRVTSDILKQISEVAKLHDLQTLFVLIPSPGEADIEEGRRMAKAFGLASGAFDLDQAHILLAGEMRDRNLALIDTTPALRAAIAKGLPDVYGHIDNHLGRQGHRVVSDTIENAVWKMFFERTPSADRQEDAVKAFSPSEVWITDDK